jgi:hypothetical protein
LFRVLFFILAVLLPLDGFALCAGDFDADGDVDGRNLQELASGRKGVTVAFFAADFGRAGCPDLPAAPVNQFTIGDSIGEGQAADGTIGEMHHEAVWSTGYAGGIVNSLNVRFAASEPFGYFENDSTRDTTFNQADSGADMVDFAAQANAVVAAAVGNPDVGAAGMVSVLIGNNDVCSAPSIAALTDPIVLDEFEQQYRAGLDALADSPATRDAFIHVSGIPAIYWLWIAKRSIDWCRFAWLFVPCDILLDNPLTNDCDPDVEDSDLDPDTIHPGDGPICLRRKQFHAAIRDVYNPILSDVLLEYKTDGRLPNAYFVDIFDFQFEDGHVNNGDCFHPSNAGHDVLAGEEWCRSHWGANDPLCGN